MIRISLKELKQESCNSEVFLRQNAVHYKKEMTLFFPEVSN